MRVCTHIFAYSTQMIVCTLLLDIELKNMLVNVSQLVIEVSHNLSVPADTVEALLSAKINFTEVTCQSPAVGCCL